MLEKKSLIDQIEVTRDGTIQIRFALVVVEDGKEISSAWHRDAIPPGVNVDARLAEVDAHLLQGIGPSSDQLVSFPAIDRGRVPQLKSIVQIVHTPETVTAHSERVQREARKEIQ